MSASTMSDFAVGSNGHCFFCLNQIMELKPPQNISLPLKTQTNSLQYLTRYLKMDLKKVFADKGQVSPELLDKVGKARLKVELCENCRCLSERFTKIYRQLGKLELELGSTLGIIHGKLVGADVTGKLQGLAFGLNPNWKGSLEVMDVLRTEAIEKSSRKLAGRPRVKIQNLSKMGISSKQFRTGNKFKGDPKTTQLAMPAENMSDGGFETSAVKTGSLNEDYLSDNDSGSLLSEDVLFKIDGEETREEEIQNDVNEDCNIVRVDTARFPRTPKNGVWNEKYTILPETGKRKCNDCLKEFNDPSAFRRHYQTVHLHIRFKCVCCSKLFHQKSHLRVHQRTSRSCSVTESSPKFKCLICEKSFSLKHHLQYHMDGVHHKLQKYACDLCGKKFNLKNKLARHKRKLHGIPKHK